MMEKQKLSVFYDGGCVLCSKEMDIYIKKDVDDRIDFIDIDAPGFDATQYGLDKDAVHERFHVITKEGTVVVGVDAFKEIWQTLGSFKLLQSLSDTKAGGSVLKLGYRFFVKVRPYLPRKQRCEEDRCSKIS